MHCGDNLSLFNTYSMTVLFSVLSLKQVKERKGEEIWSTVRHKRTGLSDLCRTFLCVVLFLNPLGHCGSFSTSHRSHLLFTCQHRLFGVSCVFYLWVRVLQRSQGCRADTRGQLCSRGLPRNRRNSQGINGSDIYIYIKLGDFDMQGSRALMIPKLCL